LQTCTCRIAARKVLKWRTRDDRIWHIPTVQKAIANTAALGS